MSWWKRRWWKLPVWAWIVIALVVVGAAGAAGDSEDPPAAQPLASDAAETNEATPTTELPDQQTTPATSPATAPSTTSTSTLPATTTSTSTTTTTPPTTTTLPPVPADVLTAYEDAGLATINPATYASRLEECDRYRDDQAYREAFWDTFGDDQAPTELAHLTPICPDAVALIGAAKPLPIIDDGVYLVPSEVPPGIYRVGRYWAMLDADQEIIDNDLVGDCLTIMVLTDEAVYVEISGEAVAVEHLPVYDPIASDCTDGTYLVGVDIQPGQYRVTPENAGDTSYWARLDGTLDIIDNDLQEGQTIVNIQPGDFAFTFSGVLEPIPG